MALFVTVCFCVWGHHYKKPTNIWTSLTGWRPFGPRRTGQVYDGMCHQDCLMGRYVKTKLKTGRWGWNHYKAIAQQSSKVQGGRGRRVGKGAIPEGIHSDILHQWRLQD